MYDIVIGRNEADKKKLGLKGTVFLGKHYVKMGQTTSLSNNIHMDVSSSHVVMIAGKRGSGKSTSAAVIAEEMTRMLDDVKENVAALLFDTLGVFWTMKYPNLRDENLLQEWDLKPEACDIKLFVPIGYFEQAKRDGIPVDKPFSIKTSELNASDWCSVFEIKLLEPTGILIDRVVEGLREESKEFGIRDIIKRVQEDKKSAKEVKDAAENRFLAADKWGLFDEDGTKIEDIVEAGKVTVLDISAYTNVSGNNNIKALVIGIVSKKLLEERIISRKKEEIENIETNSRYFIDEKVQEKPLVWLMIDECVTGDTEIITSTNHTKMEEVVKKFNRGDDVKVLSYDLESKEYLHKNVKKVFKIPNRKIVKLKTECGREIKCTPDHPLMTSNGYLSAFSAKNVVFPVTQHYSEDEGAIKARLFGYLLGDGWMSKNKQVGFSGKDTGGDLVRIKEDIWKLGFKSSEIHKRKTSSKITSSKYKTTIVNGTTYDIMASSKAFEFFSKLGAPIGKRVLKEIKLPDWIVNGTLKIKAEFLAGLMGSDGQVISAAKNAKGDFNAIRVSFNKDIGLRKEALNYCNVIKKLFEENGVRVSNVGIRSGNIRKDGITTEKFIITLAKNNKNTIAFLEKIGYRYCERKEKQGLFWLEYLKARENERIKREEIKEKALELSKDGFGKRRVGRMLGIKEYEARDCLYMGYKKGVPKSFDSFDEWLKKRLKNDFIFEKVISIEDAGIEDVYDIVVDDTHNFIANNLVSHNCHEFLPREGKTPATDALVQLLREGRQPGVSLVLVTQQPGEIHRDVLTQSDIVISHRVTAKTDIEALNSMMQSYLIADLQSYLNNLPALPGSAIILDDNSERIYPMRVHPKRSWHGGEAPSAIKVKKEFVI